MSGGQSIGVSASASVLPMNIQDLFPLGLTGLISLQSKGLLLKAYATRSGKGRIGMCVCLSWAHHHRGSVRAQEGSRRLYQRRCPTGMAYLLHLEDEGPRTREGAVLPKAG